MSDPLENDLKRMKARVPVPPDFLDRVHRQIALEEASVEKPRQISWWHCWTDFLSQNPFAVASAAALFVFAMATVIWWAGQDSSSMFKTSGPTVALQKETDQNLQKAVPSAPLLAGGNIKKRQMDKPEEQMNPDDVIVTIQLEQSEDDKGTAVGMASADESPAGIALDRVQPEVKEALPKIPVFQSKVSGEDTIKIVEQLAQKYSSALVDGKLAESRKDLKPDTNSLKTLTIEIDPAKKEAFLAALSNSLQIIPQNGVAAVPGVDAGSQLGAATDSEKSQKVHVQILVAPQKVIGAPPKK